MRLRFYIIFFIFFSLLRKKKRKRSKRKEMTHCFLQPYGCCLNCSCRQSLLYPFRPRPKGVETIAEVLFLLVSFLSLSLLKQRERKVHFFILKYFFIFFSLLRKKKRKRSKRKEMTHCFLQPYGCCLNCSCRQSLHFHTR